MSRDTELGKRNIERDAAELSVLIAQAPAAGGSDHGGLTGLADDDHSQYVHISAARTITGQHSFSPAAPAAPFVLGANAQSQLVTGLRADQLNKQVIAGAGMTGGGTLTSNATLNVIAGDGIVVAADAVAVDLATTSGLNFSAGDLLVGAGDGINVLANTIEVDVTDIIATSFGLSESANNIRINLGVSSGLEFASNALVIKVGDGVAIDGSDFLVVDLTAVSGLEFSAGDLQIADSIAGAGLSIASKVLSVDAIDNSGLAGDGLVWDAGNSELDVGAGDGINVLTSTIEVDVTDIIGAGLVEIATNNIGLNDSVAGVGLAIDGSKILSVNTGTGLTSSGDNIIHATGDLGDLHTNYPEHDQTETITAVWTFSSEILLSGTGSAGALKFTGTLGGGAEGFQYTDAGGSLRYLLNLPGSDIVALSNRASNGVVQIRANTATAGSGGEVTIAEFEDDRLQLFGTLEFQGAQSITTTTGNLTIAPAGDVLFDPTGNDVHPTTGYDLNLGTLQKKWLTLHAAELWVETLVAQNTIATIGGRILVGPTTTLTADLNDVSTTISVEHNQMVEGDVAYMEADGKVEFMYIASGPSGGGPYTYTVVRAIDPTPANDWFAGDAVFNTGAGGNGFIDLYSFAGIKSGTTGPTIVGNVRGLTTAEELANPLFEIEGSEEISNPGFETAGGGGADIWANWTENAGTGTLTNETTLVNSGADAMKAVAGAGTDDTYVSQTYSVTAGEAYKLTFWTRGDGTGNGKYAVWDNTNSANIISITATGVTGTTYTEITVYFTAPFTCSTVRLRLHSPSTDTRTAYFDDVSVVEAGTTDWLTTFSGDGTGNLDVETSLVNSGNYAIKITQGSGAGGFTLAQAITVVAGELYEMSFWTRGDGTNDAIYQIWDQTNGAAIVGNTHTGVTGTSYQKITVSFEIPALCVDVRNRMKASDVAGGICYYDDFTFNEITYNDWSEHWAIGNLDGVYGYGVDTYGLGLGNVNDNHITIDDAAGIRFWDQSGSTVGSINGGQWQLGYLSGEHISVNNNQGLRFWGGDGTTLRAQLSSDVLTMGDTTAEHVLIDSSGISLLDTNAVTVIQLDTSGNAIFGEVATNQGNVFWNSTNKRLEFRGGTAGTVVQAYVDTDGSIGAGGATATVVIDVNGITIDQDTDTTFEDKKSYSFSDGTNITGGLWAHEQASPTFENTILLTTQEITGRTGVVEITGNGASSFNGRVHLNAVEGGNDSAHIHMIKSASETQIQIFELGGSDHLVINVFPGTQLPDDSDVTVGLILNQYVADDHILEFQSTTDVAHGITTIAPTATYGFVQKWVATTGGLRIYGLSEDKTGVVIQSAHTTDDTAKTASAKAGIQLIARKKSSTTVGDAGANANLVAIMKSSSAAVWFVDVEGDMYRDGTNNTFDEYDDVHLARALDHVMDAPGRVDSEFDEFLKYGATDLERLGIVEPVGPDGERFYNVTRLQRLHNGALWQLWQENESLKRRLDKLENAIV